MLLQRSLCFVRTSQAHKTHSKHNRYLNSTNDCTPRMHMGWKFALTCIGLELSPNFGDGRGRSGGGGFGLTVGRLGDDLDPVVECHTENEFWQLVVAIETTPIFLGALDQFEDHRERGLVG